MTRKAKTPRHSNPHMDHTNWIRSTSNGRPALDLRNPSRNRHNARLIPLPLLLIALAAIAALVLIPWAVHAQTNQDATGRPVVLASAEGAGILFADTEGIADGNGLPITVSSSSFVTYTWSYQWIRVDGGTQTNVGTNSASYQPVEADVGKLIKVKVSFTDRDNFSEARTSLPFGPITELTRTSAPPSTLVSNTGQSASATANITQRYAVGFRLGDHGQGYEISSVSIELAAVPQPDRLPVERRR